MAGLPQERNRLFIILIRKDVFEEAGWHQDSLEDAQEFVKYLSMCAKVDKIPRPKLAAFMVNDGGVFEPNCKRARVTPTVSDDGAAAIKKFREKHGLAKKSKGLFRKEVGPE
eukprot:518932-Pyramimonas_sp.AAC.1